MKLLALDTSTDACSVALEYDGDQLIDHRVAPQQHAKLLLPMIQEVLAKAGTSVDKLDGIAFGSGPGSFTGVRIAAAATQGIAFGADLGVLPVSSLQALAQGAVRENDATHILPTFDARMGEVYSGVYVLGETGLVEPLVADCVCAPETVLVPDHDGEHEWCLLGSGADQYEKTLFAALHKNDKLIQLRHLKQPWPDAQDILTIATAAVNRNGFLPAVDALPVYLRDKVALTEQERAAGQRL